MMQCSTCQHKSECPVFSEPVFSETARFPCDEKLRVVTLDILIGLVIGLMAGFGLGLLFYPGFIGG